MNQFHFLNGYCTFYQINRIYGINIIMIINLYWLTKIYRIIHNYTRKQTKKLKPNNNIYVITIIIIIMMSFRKSLLLGPVAIKKRLFCNKLPVKSDQNITNTEKIVAGIVICSGIVGGGTGVYDGYKTSKKWSYYDNVGFTTCNTIAGFGVGIIFPFLLPIIIPIGFGIGLIRYMDNPRYLSQYNYYPRNSS